MHKCGGDRLFIQPCLLLDDPLQNELSGEIAAQEVEHPHVRFVVGRSFGDHRLLSTIALERVRAVDPSLGMERKQAALLLMAQATPDPAANAPLDRIVGRLGVASDYCRVLVAYLAGNEPTIPAGINFFVENGVFCMVALPFFLHRSRQVQRDLSRLLAEARQDHPGFEITQAAELGYDLRLAALIADRAQEAGI